MWMLWTFEFQSSHWYGQYACSCVFKHASPCAWSVQNHHSEAAGQRLQKRRLANAESKSDEDKPPDPQQLQQVGSDKPPDTQQQLLQQVGG